MVRQTQNGRLSPGKSHINPNQLFARSECGCAGKMPPGYMLDNYNASVPFNPIATNGEPFPWHQLQLPDSIRPVRYTLTIHPNMTSIDVKGKEPCIFTNITNITVRTVRTVRFLVHMSRL